jgi:hypothetical protein
MRIDLDAWASPIIPRDGTVDGAARHREPKAALDEQPASRAPSGLGDAVMALLGSVTATLLVVVPKLCNAISDQRVNECGVLVHGLLL